MENGPGPLGEHARRLARHPRLWGVPFSNVALVLGIVWNMTQKPSTASAILTLVIAYAVGLGVALWLSRARAEVPATQHLDQHSRGGHPRHGSSSAQGARR